MGVIQFAILGLGTGGVFVLIGQGIVLTNLGSGTLNFSIGAIGMVGAYQFYTLQGHGAADELGALVEALVVSAAIGAAFQIIVIRRLANAPSTSRIVATLALMTLLLEGVTLYTVSQGQAQAVRSPLPSASVSIGSGISVGVAQLLVAGIATGITLLLALARRRTRLGLATSAVSENRLVTASMGWNPDVLGAISWAVGSALAALAMILVAALSSLGASNMT